MDDLEPMEPEAMRRFDPIVGDTRTRAELHAMGNPAKYLDVGLVVQPMYYYLGHITRHVRPGTRPVTALVDSSADGSDSRTFRPAGQVVPGGGLNDLARTGIEATLWPCEGSTRQSWILNSDGQLQVKGHDWKGNPTSSCLKKSMDRDFYGIVLGDCNVTHAASFEVSPLKSLNNSTVELVLTNGKTESDKSHCLNVNPLRNQGGSYGPRGGAQVKYGACGASAAQWKYSEATGELVSSYFHEDGGDVCLTTGWPFLQAGAFDNNVVVVLNEANDAANFLVKDGDSIVMASSIPAHSIQTLLL
jgi:glucosylceramidase